MLRNLNVTSGGRRILGVPDVGILAATIASQTASGTNGPGLLYNEAINPANAGKQLRVRITSIPGVGNLFVYENGAIDFDDAPNGTYYVGYDWDADDAFGGSDTATIVVGAADGAAAGSTLTGTSTLTPGTAQGTSAGTAPGATLSGASSISAGSATGGSGVVHGAAPGATLSGTSDMTPGSATGNVNATAPGATLTGTSILAAGGAVNSGVLTSDSKFIIAAQPRNYTINRRTP